MVPRELDAYLMVGAILRGGQSPDNTTEGGILPHTLQNDYV